MYNQNRFFIVDNTNTCAVFFTTTFPFPALKLKTIYKCFLCPYKRQSSMLCFIEFRFSGIIKVTMQVKHAIGKATLHKLPIYNEYMTVLVLSLRIILHDLFVF